jgi:predicted nuclease of predicted toxin-antitoxin system
MQFLADMGISQSTINLLKKMGHDAVHLKDQGLQRALDREVIEKATREQRIILTCDLDFGDLMAASRELSPSIIIFRLENETPKNVNKRLKKVIEESLDALRKGAIISVEETRHRVRYLPI